MKKMIMLSIILVIVTISLVVVLVRDYRNKKYTCAQGTCAESPHGEFTSMSACKSYCQPPPSTKLVKANNSGCVCADAGGNDQNKSASGRSACTIDRNCQSSDSCLCTQTGIIGTAECGSTPCIE